MVVAEAFTRAQADRDRRHALEGAGAVEQERAGGIIRTPRIGARLGQSPS
jgi:hypothetical protein